MAIPLDNGRGLIYRADHHTNELMTVVAGSTKWPTGIRMLVDRASEGALLTIMANPVGITPDELNNNALSTIYIGGHDENPGDWEVLPGDLIVFTGAAKQSVKTGVYRVVKEIEPLEALTLSHFYPTCVRLSRGKPDPDTVVDNATPGYVHNQQVANLTWGIVQHNLGKRPQVVVKNALGVVQTNRTVIYIDQNTLVIFLPVKMTGTAELYR